MTFKRRNIRLPLVAPEAIQAYLNRPLENHDYMKDVPAEELRDELYIRGHRFAAKDEPWLRQLVCLMIGAVKNAFLFYPDMGGGKTRIAAELARYHIKLNGVRRVLVIVPEVLHLTPWEEQLPEYAPDLSFKLLEGSREQREKMLTTNTKIFVMQQGGLDVFMTKMEKNPRSGRMERVLDPVRASEFCMQFDMLVVDEIHRIKTHTSLLFKMLCWLADACPFRYGFTGTPFGKDPIALWPQFRIVDLGETLGLTLGMFRAAFFDAKVLKVRGIDRSVDYKFKPEMTEQLHEMIKHRSVRFGEDKDLPQRLALREPVRLTDEGREYYQRIVKKVREARGDYQSLDSCYTRLRQCTSGFLALAADDSSRIEVRFKTNPKLDMLRDLLEGRLSDRKLIVYHHYTYTGHMIREVLEELKIKSASIWGGTRDVMAEYYRFKREPSCQILVANTYVGSEAINPQDVTNAEIYVENHEDPIIRQQAEKRVRRPGQKSRWVLLLDIVMKGTIDDQLLQYHAEGKQLMQAVIDGVVVPDDTLI